MVVVVVAVIVWTVLLLATGYSAEGGSDLLNSVSIIFSGLIESQWLSWSYWHMAYCSSLVVAENVLTGYIDPRPCITSTSTPTENKAPVIPARRSYYYKCSTGLFKLTMLKPKSSSSSMCDIGKYLYIRQSRRFQKANADNLPS